MGSRSRLLAASLAVAGAACAPAAPPAQPSAAARPAAIREAAPLRAAPLAPLALGEDVVLVGRWRQPRVLLEQLQSWSRGAPSFELMLRGRIGKPSRPVDLDAPIEFLLVFDPELDSRYRWALSLGLEPGPESAEGPLRPRDVASPLGWSCAETGAIGPTRARMVCAASDADLARLLEPATRALPLAALGAGNVALGLHTRALGALDEPRVNAWVSERLEKALDASLRHPRFDEHFNAVASAMARELRDLAADLDGASLELSLGAAGEGLALSASVPEARGRSTLARLLKGSGASGLAPVDFWSAHGSSEDAGFWWAFDAEPIGRLRPVFAELLGSVLDFRGVPERLRREASLLVETLPLPRGPVVYASGALPAQSSRGRLTPWLSDLGWGLYAVGGSFAEVRAYVADFIKAFDDPILGAQLGRLLRSGLGERWVPARLRQRAPLEMAGLPQGSFTLEITLAPVRAAPSAPSQAPASSRERPATLFVVFAPDGDGMKLAWGADESFLVSLVGRPRPSQAPSTLQARSGLGSLHEQRTLAGGFYSLKSLASLDEALASALAGLGPETGSIQVLAQAPHRGLSPIVYGVSDAAPTLSLTAQLGRDTIEDLLFVLASGIASR